VTEAEMPVADLNVPAVVLKSTPGSRVPNDHSSAPVDNKDRLVVNTVLLACLPEVFIIKLL